MSESVHPFVQSTASPWICISALPLLIYWPFYCQQEGWYGLWLCCVDLLLLGVSALTEFPIKCLIMTRSWPCFYRGVWGLVWSLERQRSFSLDSALLTATFLSWTPVFRRVFHSLELLVLLNWAAEVPVVSLICALPVHLSAVYSNCLVSLMHEAAHVRLWVYL